MIGDIVGEIIGKVLINGIGAGFAWIFRHMGAIAKWLYYIGKKPYSEILQEGKTRLLGFFILAIIILSLTLWIINSGN